MFEFCWDFSESPYPLLGHVNVITQQLQGAYIDCLYFCIYSALRKYSAPLNFATFCHISGFKQRYKTVFFVKNQQQVGHNHEVERHLLDIWNFFNKSKTEKLGVQNYSAPLS